MATFRKRGDRWQVQVRRKGFAPVSKSFAQRKDADRWATAQERRLDEAESRGLTAAELSDITLGDILKRYRTTVVPTKRAASTEAYILAAVERRDLALAPLRTLRSDQIAAYRDQRLREIGPAGVARELRLMQHAVETARESWSVSLPENPFRAVRKPSEPRGRERRLVGTEEQRILEAAAQAANRWMRPAILFALETAMRQGEILALRWVDCDFTARVVTLSVTKNGKPRTVALSKQAVEVLERLPCEGERCFATTREALKQCWARLVRRARVSDLHFHDLRHEAISRLFELGLEMPEVAMMSGHTDPRMLMRYTHLKARSLVEKLDRFG